jgi:diguanylate cyclase (GGDEF)-like protein
MWRLSIFAGRFERDFWFDKAMARLWPTTQGADDDAVFAEHINAIYDSYTSITLGALVIAIPMLAVAHSDNIAILDAIVWWLFVPISALRHVFLLYFVSLPPALRMSNAQRHERRYILTTAPTTILIFTMLMIAMTTASYETRITLIALIVAYVAGTVARNSYIPRLAIIQAYLFMIPVVIGLTTSGRTLAIIMSLFVAGFLKYVQVITMRLKANSSESIRQARAAQKIAHYDTVTGLPNRLVATNTLETALVEPGSQITLLCLDLDQFKQVNDSRGHHAGDELLREAAGRINVTSAALDPQALTARFGGDEFVVIVRRREEQIAAAIIEALHQPFRLESGAVVIGVSIGVYRAQPGDTPTESLRKGDIALYAAKERGRNQYVVFNDAMAERAASRDLMEQRFHAALASGGLTVAFQPIYDIDACKPVAAEALARWIDPELGYVPPPAFIEIAERTGQINRLFETLLTEACSQAARWPQPIPIAFNVSATQFHNGELLVSQIRSALSISGLAPARLEIEITESVMIQDFASIKDTIGQIRAIGVRIALDDFGSGYCSLSYLDKIDFDKIKIDRSLVLSAIQSKTQAIIISMITRLATELGADVVVEGIEDAPSAMHMRQLGARYAQGFYYGRPGPTEDIFANNKKGEEAARLTA